MDQKTRIKTIATLRATANKLDPPGSTVKAAKLTRQHFIAMADAIAKLSNADDRKMMLDALTPMLMSSNPNFDMARFSKAAKVAGSVRSAGVPDAENAIRDMFLSRQYNGKVPSKDVAHILKSPRWAKMFGKGSVTKAWKSLVEEDYVEKKGSFWIWPMMMS